VENNQTIFLGQIFKDSRGELIAFNEFEMSKISRMYMIIPEPDVVRAWQGHKKETKWFFVIKGSFEIRTIQALDEKNVVLEQKKYILKDSDFKVLVLPGGNLNGFKSLKPGSCMQVFSEFNLENGKADDFRIDLDSIPWEY
jgi:dTDP-4-dehydrorhamnose 3,5-epimerase-like enzyme